MNDEDEQGYWEYVWYGDPASGKSEHRWVPADDADEESSGEELGPSIGQMIAEDMLIEQLRRDLDSWGS